MVNGYTNRICGVGLPPTSPTEEIRKINITMGVFFMVPKTISIILILEIISKRGGGT